MLAFARHFWTFSKLKLLCGSSSKAKTYSYLCYAALLWAFVKFQSNPGVERSQYKKNIVLGVGINSHRFMKDHVVQFLPSETNLFVRPYFWLIQVAAIQLYGTLTK